MSLQPEIKIFVSCNKDSYVPENSVFCKIHVGSDLNDVKISDAIQDNTGDNISAKNRSYCELTAQYWAWKNVDADYYGFFHYRRYLSFTSQKYPANIFGDINENYNDEYTLKKYGIEDDIMREVIPKYDVILPCKGRFDGGHTMYEQYAISKCQISSDLDCVLDIIKTDYPKMYKYAKSYINQKSGYFCNMFIMKKDIFNSYCEWLFDVLQKHEQRVDISNYGVQQYRVHGYLAERMLGMYMNYITHTRKLRILHLQRVLFANTDKPEKILPAFSENNTSLILAANNEYVPYLSTLLQSVVENSSEQNNYDILVLTLDINTDNQTILKKQIERKNVSLRFINVGRYMSPYRNLPLRDHFKLETYFRILLPEILPDYDKVLYLDSDMVVCADIAELYNTDIKGYMLGACLDADSAGLYNGFQEDKKFYIDNILQLKKPYDYFQAGTILFNLDEFRKSYTVKEIMCFASAYPWELLDQDVLNYFAQGKVYYFDMAWNVMMDWKGIRIKEIIALAPRYLHDQYMEARKNPKIIHYAGPDKPWDIPDSDFALKFWEYAKQSPYYELILQRSVTKYTLNTIKQKFKKRLLNLGKKNFLLRGIVKMAKSIRRKRINKKVKKEKKKKIAMQKQFIQNRHTVLCDEIIVHGKKN